MVNNNQQYFKEVIAKYRTLMQRSPHIVGTIAKGLFLESFTKQGQLMGGGVVKPWHSRGYAAPGKNRALLVNTGILRRSVQYRKAGVNSVLIYSNTPYSVMQNDGGKIKVTAAMRKFFFAMYYKHANRLVYNVADRSLKQTKANNSRNAQAEFWLHLAMAKNITIPPRPFIYDTPELPHRLDTFFANTIKHMIYQ